MSLALKIIPALIFWGIFAYVILQIPYPYSLTQANPIQLLSFFVPLFLGLIFTIDVFLKFLIRSIIISFAIIILLILRALDSVNTISVILLLAATALLFSYFKKPSSLTSEGNIPKLRSLRRRKHG